MTPGTKAAPGAIRPTLFLALGGTGKEVLLRLRRKFYEQLGVPKLPCNEYLWLDTDTGNANAAQEKADDAFAAVAFQPGEKIGLLTGSVGDSLSGALDSPEHYPNIHSWVYPQVKRYGTQVRDGAGGVRAIGRLTYFNHFRQIDTSVKAAIGRLLQHNAIIGTQDFFRARGMAIPSFLQGSAQVVLVSSLAGGTGCGTFLDAAFHLNLMMQRDTVPIERVIGILFMPNIYYDSPGADEIAQRSYGNAYAAFKELEFYTVRREVAGMAGAADFQVEWDQGNPVQVQGPPFAISYIQEMKSEANLQLSQADRPEVFNMVAETLFLDFMPGPFADAKRSDYSNVATNLASQTGANIKLDGVDLPQSFARRYASFGMAKIEIPLDQLKAACSAQLACEIASYIKRPFSDPNIQENSRRDQVACKLDKDGVPARFTEEWREIVRNAVGRAMPAGPVERLDQVRDLETALDTVETELIFAQGQDPERWGRAVSFLRKKTGNVVAGTEHDVRDWVRRTLEDGACGLVSLVGPYGHAYYLTQYLKEFYLVGPSGGPCDFDAQIAQVRSEADFYRKQRQLLLNDLKTAVGAFALRVLAVKAHSVDTLLGRIRAAEERYCLRRAEEVLLEQAKFVARAAVECLEWEVRKYRGAYRQFDAIAQAFHDQRNEFLNTTRHALFIRFFDEKRDWEACYRLGAAPVIAKAEYELLLQTPPPGAPRPVTGIVGLLEMLANRGEQEVAAILRDFCDRRFWRDFDAHPRDLDVLKHPGMTAGWADNIKRLVRQAAPMARRDEAIGGRPVEVLRVAHLGLATRPADDPRCREFVHDVRRELVDLGIDRVELAVTGKPWEVCLYIVTYAFPLPALPIVRECGRAYRDFYRSVEDQRIEGGGLNIPLHLSREWEGQLEDLEVLDPEAARRQMDARGALLFGSILKVLRADVVDGQLTYSHTTGAPLWQQRRLGGRRNAADAIAANETLREMLLQAVAASESALTDEQLLAYYWVLQYLVSDPELQPGSPEHVMLGRRMVEILARARFADPAGQNFAGLDSAAQRETARLACGAFVDWGAVPTLAGLGEWAPAAVAAVEVA
jgi:hypothetical protein